jgi:LysR family nitrogen assimilation transcriptional regulator
MDFREIRYFAQVATAGSFSLAAKELRVAQPALSRQIRKLEQELGVDLLVRHGRGVRLTGAGSILLERAEQMIHLLRNTGDEVRANANAVSGHVSLGLTPSAGLLLVSPIVRTFQREWPQVALHVRDGISNLLQEWLLDGRLDVAVLYNPPPLDALDSEVIMHEQMVVVEPPDHPGWTRRGKPQIGKPQIGTCRIRDLADMPLIMPGLPHNNRRIAEQAAVQHGVRLRVKLEVDSVTLAKAMVKNGLGCTILAYAAVHEEVMRGELKVRVIERPALVSTVAVAVLRERRADKLPNELRRTVIAEVNKLVSDGVWRRFASPSEAA